MAKRAKYSRRTVRDAIWLLDLCALTPGWPQIVDAGASIGSSDAALSLAGHAWRRALMSRRFDRALRGESMRLLDAPGAAYLRAGWLPD